jgi:hypothetical protein
MANFGHSQHGAERGAVGREIVRETRVIPLTGRAHVSPGIRQWLGEPRGRWEGRTLVVETTNFNGRFPMLIQGPGGGGVPTSESLRIVERFTRVDATRSITNWRWTIPSC